MFPLHRRRCLRCWDYRLPLRIIKMAIPNTAKREIRPTHPGEMLREDFMPDYDLSTTSMANALGVSRQTINEILKERRAISPAMALRLSRLFGNSPEFWLNVQHSWDLWDSELRYSKELSQIQPLNAAWSNGCLQPDDCNSTNEKVSSRQGNSVSR